MVIVKIRGDDGHHSPYAYYMPSISQTLGPTPPKPRLLAGPLFSQCWPVVAYLELSVVVERTPIRVRDGARS